ncbi:hypothetical protein [Microbacterium sp. Marseille-Q6648]|uniref:hypothetical protein n=1 Tax=Microbacterium sp. Marseille-Q6648 TaxID=2937991 RepID=UPI0020418FDE|nr:hypothetical protein [Microbacterium sp. Marseille-Q6648]
MMFARAAAARNLAANVLARRLAGTPPVKRPTGVFDAADAVARRWDAAFADLEARADRARAITALDRSRRSLTHLIARVDEDDAPVVERLRFGRAVLTRARMILRNDEPLPRTEPDVDGALARARVRVEGLRTPAEAEVRRARLALRDADRAVTLVAASGATQADRDAALAARAGAASALERAESALEAVGDDLEALDVVQGALRDDLYTADAALAYSLTTALVCWERQRMDAPVVARTLDVSVRVPVIREFAVTDPELATAEDFARWKARFRRRG